MDKNHAVDSSSNSSEDGTSSDGSDTEKDKTVSYLVCNINIRLRVTRALNWLKSNAMIESRIVFCCV